MLGLLGALCALSVAVLWSPSAYAQETSATLTLPTALQRALAANPRLTAAERDIGIATGQRIQAGAIPNPELSADVENVLGSGPYRGFKAAETTLQISQLVELGGKRQARIAAGVAAIDSAAWQREATLLEVLSETTSAFIAVLAGQRRIEILEAQVAGLDQLTPLLQRRVEAGASSPAEILRTQVAANLVRVELLRAKTALATAKRELALLMGEGVPKFARVVGTLTSTRQPPAFRSVLSGIDANPQLVRWTAVRAQREAELLTARLKPIPDVRAGVGWRHFSESGDNAVVFGLSMSLPVWDRNEGNTIAAAESLEKVRAERDINKAALISVASRAYESITGALQELELLHSAVLPNAREAAKAVEDGYSQGRFTLLELLDVRAAAAEAELREQEALKSYHTAIATIEGLVGRPFVSVAGRKR